MQPDDRCSRAYLTTSWDDGHPLDLRLADLLQKYGIPATFYVPRHNILPVVDAGNIRELAKMFEIGGHTLNHTDLLLVDDGTASAEIAGCRTALQDITGVACRSFCFPKGHYRRSHIAYVRDAGFTTARTVELMSIAAPREREGVAMMATTIQAHPTPAFGVLRNIAKRAAFAGALNYIRCGRTDWTKTAEALLDHVVKHGGIFHLWGHSWEIDERGEWGALERVFAAISGRKERLYCVSNGGLCAALEQEIS